MKTRRFCPHCGRPLLKSQLKGYAFQCFGCDADFYKCEVLRKRHIERVKTIRKDTYLWEVEAGCRRHSIYKPYPRIKWKKYKPETKEYIPLGLANANGEPLGAYDNPDLDKLREMWTEFGDVPIDNDECIESDFYHWPAGTDRYEIWHWFDERCPNNLHDDLMFPKE